MSASGVSLGIEVERETGDVLEREATTLLRVAAEMMLGVSGTFDMLMGLEGEGEGDSEEEEGDSGAGMDDELSPRELGEGHSYKKKT